MAQAQYFDAEGNPVDPDEAQGRMATLPRKVVRKLEREAQEGRELKAENEQLKRERAFVKAGVPLDDSRTAYFIAGYQGEQTPEAIRSEWQKLFGGGSSGQQQSAIDQELAALNSAQDLVSGVATPAPDVLSQRNAELAALSMTDPLYPQKFDAIMAKYGGNVAPDSIG